MRKYIEREVKQVKTKIDEISCDICGKTIRKYNPEDDGRFVYKKDLEMYYQVTTGHHDWGNDSHESIEEFDICANCLGQKFQEFCENRSDTKRISIQAAYGE